MDIRISWTEKKINEEVLREAGVQEYRSTANSNENNPSTATCFSG